MATITIWLDLQDPDYDDLAVLGEKFGLHPLAVEAGAGDLPPSSQAEDTRPPNTRPVAVSVVTRLSA